MSDESLLKKYRDNINKIDSGIIKLINDRVKNVIEIGKIKKKNNSPVYRPDREIEILNRAEQLNSGKKFPTAVLLNIYREIISACRKMESSLEIAFFGPEATHTHLAAMTHFGSSCTFIPFRTITDVFRGVEAGKAVYGVVPVENSTEGAVNHTLDMFITSPLQIAAEHYLGIHHNLLSICGELSGIKTLYSHPQPFAQCRLWIENNLPNAELKEVSSTSEAVKVCQWDKYSAAIASRAASDVYNIKILAENIEDNPSNFTRFLIISKKDSDKITVKAKTSIIFAVKDKSGALNSILQIFAKSGINLNKIESRPAGQKAWEYLFFVDLDGHRNNENIKKALAKVESNTTFLKILGSYPKYKIQSEI